MHIFVRLSKKDLKNLFYKAKEKSHLSFNQLYLKLNISRAMFFNYLSGRYDLPKAIFLKLEHLSGEKLRKFKEIKKEKYMEKLIKKPKLNKYLAEALGVLNGDGHVSQINSEICVVMSSIEKDYMKYLKKLFENTFGLDFRVYEQDTKLKLRANSKRLANFLHQEYGVPKGNKLGKLKIPKCILCSDRLLICYLRGLFDTDGSFFIRRKKDPVIEIISADPGFLAQIKNALIHLGFNAGMSGKHVYIYNKDHINRFFHLVKPANSKHLKKYKMYSN